MKRNECEVARELLAYLPQLDAGPIYGTFDGAGYEYLEHVEQFFEKVGNYPDYGYTYADCERVEWMRKSREDFPDQANLKDCLLELIRIRNAERFCDGAWVAAIRSGRVLAVLCRIRQLLLEG